MGAFTIPGFGSKTSPVMNDAPWMHNWDGNTSGFDFSSLFSKGGGLGDGTGIGGHNNGTNLAGTWASSGFGGNNGPSASGFNFFNPMGNFTIPGVSPGSFGVGGGNNFPAFKGPQASPSGFNSSSFPGLPQVGGKDLQKLYGKGVGNALSQFLNSGAGFNPQVVQALIDQAQPFKAQQEAKMMDLYGDMGSAYSSTAALGISGFDAQFDAALEGRIANLYENSVQNYLNVLMNVKGDAKEQQAQGFHWTDLFAGFL